MKWFRNWYDQWETDTYSVSQAIGRNNPNNWDSNWKLCWNWNKNIFSLFFAWNEIRIYSSKKSARAMAMSKNFTLTFCTHLNLQEYIFQPLKWNKGRAIPENLSNTSGRSSPLHRIRNSVSPLFSSPIMKFLRCGWRIRAMRTPHAVCPTYWWSLR